MIRSLLVALAVAALLVPAAFAGTSYRAGQKCSAKKEATYVAHHFKCVKGKLHKMKKA